jgi:hypothetical protein
MTDRLHTWWCADDPECRLSMPVQTMRPKTRPADPEFMVTVADVARSLGTTPATIHRWHREHGFPLRRCRMGGASQRGC